MKKPVKIYRIIFFTIILVGGIFFFYKKYFSFYGKDVWDFIPPDAFFVFEGENAPQMWEQISRNKIWLTLADKDFYKSLNQEFRLWKNIIEKSDLKDVFEKAHVLISAHVTGADEWNFLFLIELGGKKNFSAFTALMQDSVYQTQNPYSSFHTYEGEDIHELYLQKSKKKIAFARLGKTIILSPNSLLVEGAIRQGKSGKSLRKNKSFKKIISDKKNENNFFTLYINYADVNNFLSLYLNKENNPLAETVEKNLLASHLQIKLSDNLIQIDGETDYNDKNSSYFGLSEKGNGSEMEKYISSDAAYFVQIKINNSKNRSLGLAALDGTGNEKGSEIIGWIEVSDTSQIKNELIENSLPEKDSIDMQRVYRINTANFFESNYGSLFHDFEIPYWTFIEKYLVIANSINTLEKIIEDIKEEKTLSHWDNYKKFRENFNEESNIFCYVNPSKFFHLPEIFSSKDMRKNISGSMDMIQKFEYAGVEFTKDEKGRCFTHFVMNFNSSHRQEINLQWKFKANAKVETQPLFCELEKGENGVLIADKSGKIYLLDADGNLLWNKKIESAVIGHIHYADLMENENPVFVFTTRNQLYLIDRNGQTIKNFPIRLPAEASAGVSVVDLGGRGFILLVPTMNEKNYAYNSGGVPDNNWNAMSLKGVINQEIKSTTIVEKNILYSCTGNGYLYVWETDGTAFAGFPVFTNSNLSNEVFYVMAGEGYFVTTKSDGTVVRYNNKSLKGEEMFLGTHSPNHILWVDEKNAIGEILIADDERLIKFSADKNILWQNEVKGKVSSVKVENGVTYAVTESENVYAFSKEGNLLTSFPIKGSGKLAIGNLTQEGNLNICVGGSDGVVYLYQIE